MIHPIAQESKASIEKEDLNIFLRSIQPYKLKTILEIGTWKGHSAQVWIETFHPDIFITIEKDKEHDDSVVFENPNYHYMWQTDSQSDKTLEKVKNIVGERQIEYLFIDAAHTYADVRRDFELYSPLVKDGGYIAFHDILYIDKNCQVKTLWEQLKRKYYYVECNIGTGSTGFGFIRWGNYDTTVAQKTLTL